MIMHLLAGQAFLTSLIAGALAHDNGMDMSMDQGMAMNSGNMLMYLHFTIGDNLWFLGWAPNTAGAMVGACIGLFMLAMAERWLVHVRGVMEEHWSMRSVLPLCAHTFCCSIVFLMHLVIQCSDCALKQAQQYDFGVPRRAHKIIVGGFCRSPAWRAAAQPSSIYSRI
jgi:hypothetical protein